MTLNDNNARAIEQNMHPQKINNCPISNSTSPITTSNKCPNKNELKNDNTNPNPTSFNSHDVDKEIFLSIDVVETVKDLLTMVCDVERKGSEKRKRKKSKPFAVKRREVESDDSFNLRPIAESLKMRFPISEASKMNTSDVLIPERYFKPEFFKDIPLPFTRINEQNSANRSESQQNVHKRVSEYVVPIEVEEKSKRKCYQDPYKIAQENEKRYWRERRRNFDLELRRSGLEIKEIVGDGNCLFRAIAQAVYGSQNNFNKVRQETMDYISENRAAFENFIAVGDGDKVETFEQYVARKRRSGVHGNNIEIVAMATFYQREIHVHIYTAIAAPEMIFRPAIIFNQQDPTPDILLSYESNSHYNRIVPRDEKKIDNVDKIVVY